MCSSDLRWRSVSLNLANLDGVDRSGVPTACCCWSIGGGSDGDNEIRLADSRAMLEDVNQASAGELIALRREEERVAVGDSRALASLLVQRVTGGAFQRDEDLLRVEDGYSAARSLASESTV